MRKLLLAILPPLLLVSLAGCAHQGGAYAPSYAGYAFDDCDFEGDCFGGLDRTTSSCVFVQNPAAPARLAIIVPPQHHMTRVVNRGDSMRGTPSPDSSWNGNSSASAPPPASFAPASVAREPVILVSPAGDGRSPRTPG